METALKTVWTKRGETKRGKEPMLLARRINEEWLKSTTNTTGVRFVGPLQLALIDLRDAVRDTRRNLPINSLRLMVQASLEGVINVDKDLGYRSKFNVPAIEMHETHQSDQMIAVQVAEQMRKWCMNSLEIWAEREQLGEIAIRVKAACTAENIGITKSMKSLRDSKSGFPNFPLIARMIAEQLSGETLFSGMGTCEIVLPEFESSHNIDVMSFPCRPLNDTGGKNMFSMIARIHISTVPYSKAVYFSVSVAKRIWAEVMPNGGNTGVNATGYVMAPGQSIIPVGVSRRKINDVWTWNFDAEYASLNDEAQYSLPHSLSDAFQKMAFDKEKWWVGLPQITRLYRHVDQHSPLEPDEVELLNTVLPLLDGVVDTAIPINVCRLTLNKKPESAMLRLQDVGAAGISISDDVEDEIEVKVEVDEDDQAPVEVNEVGERSAVAKFREQCVDVLTKAHCVNGKKPAFWVIGGSPKEQELAAKTVELLFGDAVDIKKDPMPPGVHDLKGKLPGDTLKARQRFNLRVDAWKKSGLPQAIGKHDGEKFVLICAAKDIDRRSEDPVNRRAAIHAFCKEANANVHHVLPIEAANTDKREVKAMQSFIHRVQSAIMDVMLAHSGYVIGAGDFVAGQLEDEFLPKAIYGIQAFRKNAQRYSGETPVCLIIYSRLNLQTNVTEVMFAYKEQKRTCKTGWMKLAKGLIWLGTQRSMEGDEDWLKAEFVGTTIKTMGEINENDPKAIVFIDWGTLPGLWKDLTDANLESNEPCLGHVNLAKNFPQMSFVRLRYGRNALLPLRIWNKTTYEAIRDDGSGLPTGEYYDDGYAATVKQLIEINPDPVRKDRGHFVGVMGPRKTFQLKRGKSCFRFMVRMSALDDKVTGTKGRGLFEKKSMPPQDKDATIPSSMDITVLYSPNVSPIDIATLAMGLRVGYAHYDDWTMLPAPLFFARKIDDYIIKYPTPELDAPDAGTPQKIFEIVDADTLVLTTGDVSDEGDDAAGQGESNNLLIMAKVLQREINLEFPIEAQKEREAPEPPGVLGTDSQASGEVFVDAQPAPAEEEYPDDDIEQDGATLITRAKAIVPIIVYPVKDLKLHRLFTSIVRGQNSVIVELPYFVKIQDMYGKYKPDMKKGVQKSWKQIQDFNYVKANKSRPGNGVYLDWLAEKLIYPQGAYVVHAPVLFGRAIILPQAHSIVQEYNTTTDKKIHLFANATGEVSIDLSAIVLKATSENDDYVLGWLIFASAQTPGYGFASSVIPNLTTLPGPMSKAATLYYLQSMRALKLAGARYATGGAFTPIHFFREFNPVIPVVTEPTEPPEPRLTAVARSVKEIAGAPVPDAMRNVNHEFDINPVAEFNVAMGVKPEPQIQNAVIETAAAIEATPVQPDPEIVVIDQIEDEVMELKTKIKTLIDGIEPGSAQFHGRMEIVRAHLDALASIDSDRRLEAEKLAGQKNLRNKVIEQANLLLGRVGTVDEDNVIGAYRFVEEAVEEIDPAMDELTSVDRTIVKAEASHKLLQDCLMISLAPGTPKAERIRHAQKISGLSTTLNDELEQVKDLLDESDLFESMTEDPAPSPQDPTDSKDSSDSTETKEEDTAPKPAVQEPITTVLSNIAETPAAASQIASTQPKIDAKPEPAPASGSAPIADPVPQSQSLDLFGRPVKIEQPKTMQIQDSLDLVVSESVVTSIPETPDPATAEFNGKFNANGAVAPVAEDPVVPVAVDVAFNGKFNANDTTDPIAEDAVEDSVVAVDAPDQEVTPSTVAESAKEVLAPVVSQPSPAPAAKAPVEQVEEVSNHVAKSVADPASTPTSIAVPANQKSTSASQRAAAHGPQLTEAEVALESAYGRLKLIMEMRHYGLAGVYVGAMASSFVVDGVQDNCNILAALADTMESIDCGFVIDSKLHPKLRKMFQASTTAAMGEYANIGMLAAGFVSAAFSSTHTGNQDETEALWSVVGQVQQPLAGHTSIGELLAHLVSREVKGITLSRETLAASKIGTSLAMAAELARACKRAEFENWRKDTTIHSSFNHHGFNRLHEYIYSSRHHIGQCLECIAKNDLKGLKTTYEMSKQFFKKPNETVANVFKAIGEKSKPDGAKNVNARENIEITERFIKDFISRSENRTPNNDLALHELEYLKELHTHLRRSIVELEEIDQSGLLALEQIYVNAAKTVFQAVLRLFDETTGTTCMSVPQQKLLVQQPMDRNLNPSIHDSEEYGVKALVSGEDVIQTIDTLLQEDLAGQPSPIPTAAIDKLMIEAQKTHLEENRFLPAFVIDSLFPKGHIKLNPPLLQQYQTAKGTLARVLQDARQRVTHAMALSALDQKDANSLLRTIESIRASNLAEQAIGHPDGASSAYPDFPHAKATLQNQVIRILDEKLDEAKSSLLQRLQEHLDAKGDECLPDVNRIRAMLSKNNPASIRTAYEAVAILRTGHKLPSNILNSGRNAPQEFNQFLESLQSIRGQSKLLDSLEDLLAGTIQCNPEPACVTGLSQSERDEACNFISNWKSMCLARGSEAAEQAGSFFSALGIKPPSYQPPTIGASRTQAVKFEFPSNAFVSLISSDCFIPPDLGSTAKLPVGYVLHGSQPELEIASLVQDSVRDSTFILSRANLTLVKRAKISAQSPVILIDDNLIAYMALHTEDRAKRMMEIGTLTFHTKPYSAEGQYVPREMFFGREDELKELRSVQNLAVLYGGRRLGKSSLLAKIEREENAASGGSAIYLQMQSDYAGEDHVLYAWRKIYGGLLEAHVIEAMTDSSKDWQKYRDWVEAQLISPTQKKRTCYLLFDEADDLMAHELDLKPNQPGFVRSLQQMSENIRTKFHLRFVVAGLHNLAQWTTESNSALGKAQTIALEPFNSDDNILRGVDLVTKPMAALGFFYGPGNEDLPLQIMSICNFYPAMIQIYCRKLLDHMYNKRGPNEAFKFIEASDLNSVEGDQDLLTELQEKFALSLKLDKRYFVIALILADYYYAELESGKNEGLTVSEISTWCETETPAHFQGMSPGAYEGMCDAMKKLNVLERNGSRYRLRNPSIAMLIGDRARIQWHLKDLEKAPPEKSRNHGDRRFEIIQPLLPHSTPGRPMFPMPIAWTRSHMEDMDGSLVILSGNNLSGLTDITQKMQADWRIDANERFNSMQLSAPAAANYIKKPWLGHNAYGTVPKGSKMLLAISPNGWKTREIPQFAAVAKKACVLGVRLILLAGTSELYEVSRLIGSQTTATAREKKSEWSVAPVPPWSHDALRFYLQNNSEVSEDHEACSAIIRATCGFGKQIQRVCKAKPTIESAHAMYEKAKMDFAPDLKTFYLNIGFPGDTVIDLDLRTRMEGFMLHVNGEQRNSAGEDGYLSEFKLNPSDLQYLFWMGLVQEGAGNTWFVPELYLRLLES